MSLDVVKVERYIREQALIVHTLLRDVNAYRVPLTEADFLQQLSPQMAKWTAFASEGSWKFTEMLLDVPLKVEREIGAWLPAQTDDLIVLLRRQAERLYAFVNTFAPVDLEEFEARTRETIRHNAARIHQKTAALSVGLLTLPTQLLHAVRDLLPHLQWDYEFGWRDLLIDMRVLFQRAGLVLTWKDDPAANRVFCHLGAHTWQVEALSLRAEINFEIVPNFFNPLRQALRETGYVLHPVLKGDQTQFELLLPQSHADAASALFPDVHTHPAMQLLYPFEYHHRD